MRFLLDENIPIEAENALVNLGHDVKNVYIAKLAGKNDNRVISFAKKEKRILITLDLDFSNILIYPPKSHPGIIVIRLNAPGRKRIINALEQFVENVREQDISKALVILEDFEYRLRK